MRKTSIAVVIGLSVLSGAPSSPAPLSLTYDVVAVKSKLFLVTSDGEDRLQAGASAASGDFLRTGWRGRAELAVPERAARFHLGPSTRFRLAHDRPGVLLEIEKGRLRAIFGSEKDEVGSFGDRLVTTPSAVLAVRGTEYGVEVGKNGETSVVVFEGVVEVKDIDGLGEPVMVRHGESCRVRMGASPSAPRQHGLSAGDWERGRGVESPMKGLQSQTPMMAGERGMSGSPGASSSGGGSKRHGG